MTETIINGQQFYTDLDNAEDTFNRIEVTLSHLFRSPRKSLRDLTYSDKFFGFLDRHDYLRPEITEIGCGLGDIAFNFLSHQDQYKHRNKKYTLLDISPELSSIQKQKLSGFSECFFISDSCFNLEQYLSGYNGLILSNGMIADLESLYSIPTAKISEMLPQSDKIRRFYYQQNLEREGFYFHSGAMKLVMILHDVLADGGIAVISEYSATELNQPSWFDGHFECGIDFSQLVAFADYLGMKAILYDVEQVLGIREDQRLLSMDIFTQPHQLAKTFPNLEPLLLHERALPVMAYTPNELFLEIAKDEYGFSLAQQHQLLDQLTGFFHSIHDPKFDSLNPTSWSYQYLVLEKDG